MENDYYLHNFHVKSGLGMTTTMKTYQRAFGIDWNENEEDYSRLFAGTDMDSSSTPAPVLHADKYRTTPSIRHDNDRMNRPYDSTTNKPKKESTRVLRVRNRCKAQNQALSMWWKSAIQYHFQQRMYMRLGTNCVDPELPPRFERIYQPEKLSQFDRFFSRTWSTPVRRSHSEQHTDGIEDGEAPDFSRVVSTDFTIPSSRHLLEKTDSDDGLAVSEFIKKWGFGSRSEPTLKLFAEHHNPTPGTSEYGYIGNYDASTKPPKHEYVHYVSPPSKAYGPPNTYRASVVDEFKVCLHDYTLESDDVSGIQKVGRY